MSQSSERVTISGELTGEVDCKRFYLTGLTVRYACPACGATTTEPVRYLSYPRMNEPFEWGAYCTTCEHEWQERAVLRVALELAPGAAP